LEGYVPLDVSLNAVYPHGRHLSPKVRAFVDHLAESFGPEPYWDRGIAWGDKA
jgi:DNA-binding transcriptional LysR family regulator